MTTAEAAAQYLSDHLREWAGKGYAVHNPKNVPIEDLPVIYGFNNGGSPGWMFGQLISEDGEALGSHCCSAESYMPHDLGIIEGSRSDRHDDFREHYPNGYRMDFVRGADVDTHEKLNIAFANHSMKYGKEE